MGRGVVLAGFLVVAMLACLGGAAATVYVVGDNRRWTTSNITVGYYSDVWAANKTFRVGDSLVFVICNGTHKVAIVSREDYDNCTTVNSSSAGDTTVIFTPDASGSYYFISPVDADCENGLKLAINVTTSPNSSASSITAGALSVLVLVSSSIIAMFMN